MSKNKYLDEVSFHNIMGALSDPTRTKMIYLLSKSSFCPIHLEKILEISQVNISRHGEKLIYSNIVSGVKKGRRVIYSLREEFIQCFPCVIENLNNLYGSMYSKKDIEQYALECAEM